MVDIHFWLNQGPVYVMLNEFNWYLNLFYIRIFYLNNFNSDQITLLWSFGAEVLYTSFLMKFVSDVKLGVRLCEVKCNKPLQFN